VSAMKLVNTSIFFFVNVLFMVTLVHASALSKEDHKLTSIINDFEAFYLTSSPFQQPNYQQITNKDSC
jgi:hypothetical protein